MPRKTPRRPPKNPEATRPSSPKDLPPEFQEPTRESKRLALITVIGIVVVLGIAGAVIELTLAPLFETPTPLAPGSTSPDLTLTHRHHVHAPVTSELDFLIQMVPHHQEAVDTSRIIATSTTNPELKTLAEAIIEAQQAEIIQMDAWLDAWYPGQRYPHSYEPMMPDLERLDGTLRDEAYLRGMIDHHTMAIHMARQVKELDPRPEVKALADIIILTQTEEIVAMERLLG